MMPVALCLIVHPLLSRVGIRLQCRFWRDIRSGFVLLTTLSRPDDLLSKMHPRVTLVVYKGYGNHETE